MNETVVPTAFLDASVLYPALLRNILMRLALQGLFRARWSARVHDEWTAALLRNRPDLTHDQIERTRRLMDMHVQDAVVVGFEYRIEGLTLPDSSDRHVLAAAIHCDANVIVTANLRDFPASALASFGIEATHPDAFIASLFENNRGLAAVAFRRLRASLKKPPMTADVLLAEIRHQGLSACADALQGLLETD